MIVSVNSTFNLIHYPHRRQSRGNVFTS